jgi:hypothetical protein
VADKRRWVRTKPRGLVSTTGKILLEPNAAPIECTVLDLSVGGACLVPTRLEKLPKSFVFLHGGVRKICSLAWQRGCRIGITFSANTERSVASVGLSRSSRDRRI